MVDHTPGSRRSDGVSGVRELFKQRCGDQGRVGPIVRPAKKCDAAHIMQVLNWFVVSLIAYGDIDGRLRDSNAPGSKR